MTKHRSSIGVLLNYAAEIFAIIGSVIWRVISVLSIHFMN